MTTTMELINKDTYNNTGIAKCVGTLLFGDDWYDCTFYVDLKKLRKNLPPLPKGSRILKVLVKTKSHPEFKNVANRLIPYKSVVCADKTDDGAEYMIRPYGNFWGVLNPLGDAVVVVSKL